MTDIAPELLASIQGKFANRMATDKTLGPLAWAVRDGTANYETVNQYAIRLGELLADSMKLSISANDLPDGRLYYNIAEQILGPLLTENHRLVADAAVATQEAMNKASGIGLKAIRPELNQSRVIGLAEKVSSYESFEEAAWVLDDPVVNFTQSVVDEAIKQNVAAHAAAGLNPTVRRIAEPGCCPWCSGLEGTYAYPVEGDVYRRHERCRCTVLYDPGSGKVQNVHTKVLYASAAKAERDARIARVRNAARKR